MTDDLSGFEDVPFDPASMPTSSLGITKAVWYRRPWVLASLSVIVIVAVLVVIDLPRPITHTQDAGLAERVDQGDQRRPRRLRVRGEGVASASTTWTSIGKLTSSDLAQVPTLLTGDETACSFASEPVYDLTNNLQVDDTKSGKHIDRMLSAVERWITDYAPRHRFKRHPVSVQSSR